MSKTDNSVSPCNTVLPDGWRAVPYEYTDDMGKASAIVIEVPKGSVRMTVFAINRWHNILTLAPPCPILTEKDVADKARRAALEEAIATKHDLAFEEIDLHEKGDLSEYVKGYLDGIKEKEASIRSLIEGEKA